MNKKINTEACISLGNDLIQKEEHLYVLEVYDKTINGKNVYINYGRFRDLDSSMSTAKRIERTKERLR